MDVITSWIHRPTAHHWYLVEDTAQPIACARLPLPHQIEFILAKLTLRWMTHNKRGSVAKPVESGRSLSPTLPCPMSYVGAVLSTIGGTASRHCKSSRQQRLTSWPLSRSIGRLADTNGLVAALVVATYLGRPIRQMRPLPPTLKQQLGDFTADSVQSHVGASKQPGSSFASIFLPPTLHH